MAKVNRENAIEAKVREVGEALGVPLTLEKLSEIYEFEYRIRVATLPHPKGFAVYVGDDYLSWTVKYESDTDSRALLKIMAQNYSQRKGIFNSYLELIRSRSITFVQNFGEVDSETENEPEWSDFNLLISEPYSSESQSLDVFYTCLLDFFCISLSLLVKEVAWEEINSQTNLEETGEAEGARFIKEVTGYERSRFNRALCLRYYGFICRGCGIEMEKVYGPLGQGVIHVHHLVPVSQMGGTYVLNPVTDLIPLCPNCHNVVHRENPPTGMDELRRLTGYSAVDSL